MKKKIIVLSVVICTILYNTVLSYNDDWVSDYAYPSFKILMDSNIITGINGKKKPHNNITKAEFLKIAIETAKKFTTLKIDIQKNNNKKHWAGDYINTSIQYGFIETDQFNPDEYITRAQAADILVKIFGLNNILGVNSDFYRIFSDVDINARSLEILWIHDIVSGYSHNKMKPFDFITREQATAILLGKHMPNNQFTIKGVVNPKINKSKIITQTNVDNAGYGIFLLNNNNQILFPNTISNKVMDVKIKLKYTTNIKKVIFKKEGLSHNGIFESFMLYLNDKYIGQTTITPDNNIIIETNNAPVILADQENILSLRVSIKSSSEGALFKILLHSIFFNEENKILNIFSSDYKVSTNTITTQSIILYSNNIVAHKINNFDKDVKALSFNIINDNFDINYILKEVNVHIEGSFNENELNNFRLLVNNNVLFFGERISKNQIRFIISPSIIIEKKQSVKIHIVNDININNINNDVKYRLYIRSKRDIVLFNDKYNFVEDLSANNFPIYGSENFFTNN